VELELRLALERLVYLNEIRKHVLRGFGPSRNARARLRHSDVTRHVAKCLGREFSPALGRDVLQAMRSHGWRSVRHATMNWWKGVRKL
jgi:hypothetical protein